MSDERNHMMKNQGEKLPEPSERLSWSEFLEETRVEPARLTELIELGWLEPAVTGEEMYLFLRRDVYRTRKLERICVDLGVTAVGGTIIVDLLARIERLEKKIKELEQFR